MHDKPISVKPIGRIHNDCRDVGKAAEMRESVSTIELDKSLADGFYMIESHEYIDVVFHFHESSDDVSLRVTTPSGETKGVFSTRSPVRPNHIGITTVRLLEREGNTLRVSGLDAVNGTPVLDIKAADTSRLENEIHHSVLRTSPRISIRKAIMANDTGWLLTLASGMHGHYCPGLAMGVMAATRAMREMMPGGDDGLEDLLAIVETNNCLADGVQLVTGCSFGNNSLIFHDIGKTAFTLARRDGTGIRIVSRPESQEYIRNAFPDFQDLYKRVVKQQNRDESLVAAYKKSGTDRSFGVLKLDFDTMFDIRQVTVSIPDYAPSHHSFTCEQCGESVMASRMADHASSGALCYSCAGNSYYTLDGSGIHTNK